MGHLLLLSLALFLVIATASHIAAGHAQAAAITQEERAAGMTMSMVVGSRPPSCEGRCWWCGRRRCEAVQVPVTPQELQSKARGHGHGHRRGGGPPSSRPAKAEKPSSYEDHSNYKPLSWRCKCGAVFLDP
ncbi:hypothetical protein ACP70R_032235 [Stipagrostis hirtigluma subsp. patula]